MLRLSAALLLAAALPAAAQADPPADGESAPRPDEESAADADDQEAAADDDEEDELAEGEVLILEDDGDDFGAGEDEELAEGETLKLTDDDEQTVGEPGAEEAPAEDGPEKSAWVILEENITSFVEGNWLDPPGEFWAVRRGARLELAFFLGGEAAAGKIQPGDILVVPDIGGVVLSPVGRWYPVDQVAIMAGARGYLGINAPAAGTGAQTVLTPFLGVRYDLVKEGRLSILIDVYSGPAAFVFASLTDPGTTQNLFDRVVPEFAVGAEIAGGLVGRYSLGPTTFELRGLIGGRAGSAQTIGRPTNEPGPFSAFYAGLDLGITWSFLADGVPAPGPEESDG